MKRELICISCPIGCELTAARNEDGSLSVHGNQCPKGEDYAREEINAPKRIVTTTVALEGNVRLRVPVRTDKPLPVEQIKGILSVLHSMKLSLPVRRGDLILEDFQGAGVDVVASLSVGV